MKAIAIPGCSKAAAVAVACSLLQVPYTLATETDLHEIDSQSLFSPVFFSDLEAAKRSNDPVVELKALHQKYARPAEQAEIELTIARLFNQRTGYVDPVESIKWYDRALVRELPATALAKQFIHRGKNYQRLEDYEKALADYVRGMLACLQFNLPDSWPNRDAPGKLKPPPIGPGKRLPGEDEPTEEQLLARRQQNADYWRDRNMTQREQDLLRVRYYYLDAIKRVMKKGRFREEDLRATAEKLTNRKDRIDELVRRVREPNPQPWP